DQHTRGVTGHLEALETAPGGLGDVGLEVPVRDGGGGDADRGHGRKGDGRFHALIGRQAGFDQRVDRSAGRNLGDGEVALEVEVHVGAVRRADAPCSRLEEDADVPGRAALPVAGEEAAGDVGDAAVERIGL